MKNEKTLRLRASALQSLQQTAKSSCLPAEYSRFIPFDKIRPLQHTYRA